MGCPLFHTSARNIISLARNAGAAAARRWRSSNPRYGPPSGPLYCAAQFTIWDARLMKAYVDCCSVISCFVSSNPVAPKLRVTATSECKQEMMFMQSKWAYLKLVEMSRSPHVRRQERTIPKCVVEGLKMGPESWEGFNKRLGWLAKYECSNYREGLLRWVISRLTFFHSDLILSHSSRHQMTPPR